MKKKQFVTPRVLQEVQVRLEKDLLQASVRFDMTVTSMGQGVENYEFIDDPNGGDYLVEWD